MLGLCNIGILTNIVGPSLSVAIQFEQNTLASNGTYFMKPIHGLLATHGVGIEVVLGKSHHQAGNADDCTLMW